MLKENVSYGEILEYMSFLASLLAQLEEKNEQLRRLKVCAGQLENLQGEFIRKHTVIVEPELTAKTWKGSLASEFLGIRAEMSFEYSDIVYSQLALSQQTLDSKIAEIELHIETLKTSITAEKARLIRFTLERNESYG